MIGELDISALSDRELKRRIYEAAKLPHVVRLAWRGWSISCAFSWSGDCGTATTLAVMTLEVMTHQARGSPEHRVHAAGRRRQAARRQPDLAHRRPCGTRASRD